MALQTGATIVPMGIRGTHHLLKPHSLRVKLNQHIDIYFGKPIDATQYTMETRQQLIHNVEKELRLAAGLQ
jgi:1-acyl-sn-glycerol-3-phosphate acyltransferase